MADQTLKEKNFFAMERVSVSYDNFNAMRRNDQLCDVQFVIGNKKISAHKMILASHSDYFKNMFTGIFKESKLLEVKNVEITPDSLEILIDFIYTSKITIKSSNVQELLIASNFLLFNDVKEECLKYLEQTISIDNCMTIKDIALSYKISDLYDIVLSFVQKNYNEISSSNDFLMLTFDQIKEFIQSDSLNANEVKIYESIIFWVKYDENKRSTFLPELIKYIRMSMIPASYFIENIENENILQLNCKSLLYEALKMYTYKCVESHRISSSYYANRLNYKNNQLILTLSWNDNRKYSLKWFTATNGTFPSKKFSWKSDGSSIILNDGRIFRTDYCSKMNNWSVDIFDGATNQWGSVGSLKTVKYDENIYHLYLVEMDGCVYVMSRSGYFKCYKIRERKWLDLGKIDVKYFGCLVVLNGFIYFVTFCNELDTGKVLQYNPKTNRWQVISQTSHNTAAGCAICSLNGFIYVIGGRNKERNECLKLTSKFDPSTNTWSDTADMNIARSRAGAIAVNGLIYVLGGKDCDSCEIYEPQRNKWTLSKYKLRSKKQLQTLAFTLNPEANINPNNISNYYRI